MKLPPLGSPIWRWLGFAVVLAVAAALHGSLFWLSLVPGPRTLMGDELVYWPAARLLAEGAEPLAYSPLWPPLYLRFLAALVVVFGAEPLAVEIVQTLMLFAVVFFLWDLTRAWTGSSLAAACAASLALIYPPWAAFAHYFWPEVLHLFLFLGAVWVLARRPPRTSWLVVAGLLLGLATLTKSLLVPFLPMLLFPLLKSPMRQAAGRVSLVGLGLGIALVLTGFAFGPHRSVTAGAATFNLWVGLNDTSRTEFVDSIVKTEHETYLRSAASIPERNEILRRKIADKIRAEGVVETLRGQLGRQYFRLFDKESFLTVQLRGKAIHPAAPGYLDPPAALVRLLSASSVALYVGLLVGAAVGIAVCPPRKRPWLRVALAFLVYNLVIFLALHVKSRYRVQFLPFLFIYFGCAVAWLAARWGWSSREHEFWAPELSRTRGVVTLVAGVLLLFLAFGGPMLDAAAPLKPIEGPADFGPMRLDPNPIRVCDGSGLGVTTLSWDLPGESGVFEARVDAPAGALFARLGTPGVATTGKWARDGMVFFLVEVETGEVLARATVRVTRSGCR